HQVTGLGIGSDLGDVFAETVGQRVADDRDGDRPETKEHDRLENVHPNGAAHAAEENVDGHHQGHDCAPEPIMNPAAADIAQDPAAAHDADDHIRNEHDHAEREDNGANRRTFPTIAEETDLGLVAEAFA